MDASEFIFKKSKQQKFSNLRKTDKISFYLRPQLDLPKDLCSKGFKIQKLSNLNVLNKPGREFGDRLLYDPIDTQNYLSQFERYDKSLKIFPDKVEIVNNKLTYFYCSSDSPTGFWEVVVGGNGTYINFYPPILTIICPRPFRLQDLIEVDTDGQGFIWNQLQGRITIISPLNGENSLNPFISIIGNRAATDPPILLEATLDDNDSVAEFIAIATTIKEFFDGFNIFGDLQKDAFPDLSIPCNFYPVIIGDNLAFLWSSGFLGITFDKPKTQSNNIYQYWLQENINGIYQTIQQINNNRFFTIEANKRYRIVSIFKTLANDFFGTLSCNFEFNYFPRKIFSADKLKGFNIWNTENNITQYPLNVISCPTTTELVNGFNIWDIDDTVVQFPLSVISCPTTTELINGFNIWDIDNSTIIYNLVGSIVG